MPKLNPIRYKAATAVFKLASKTSDSGMHRTTNRAPKGSGWLQCLNAPQGMMCRHEKIREAIEYFKIAYEIWPDIVAINQIALSYEMIGEGEMAREYFQKMKTQAEQEDNEVYLAI